MLVPTVTLISLYRIRRKRPSLRLIVSSATLDATSFLDYFTSGTNPDETTIVSLEGRLYPVEVAYLEEPTPDYVKKSAEVAWHINLQVRPFSCHIRSATDIYNQAESGDVLIFLTGREEIEGCLEELAELLSTSGFSLKFVVFIVDYKSPDYQKRRHS
jgi:ATP-dependent RNA helicase DDX35